MPTPQITKESNLGEVAWKYPEAAKIMMEYGLHCVGCFAADMDSVGDGAMIHGMSDEEMNEMLGRLNEAVIKHHNN